MMRLHLRTQIILLTFSAVCITGGAMGLSYWMQASALSHKQIERHMNSAENVVNQYLASKEQLLITAAKGVTSDFAFKQALAVGETDTQVSALENAGERINAELLIFVDTDQNIALFTKDKTLQISSIQAMLPQINFNAGASQLLQFENNIYQLISIPIQAPVTIGYTLIGFTLDEAALSELKQLSGLDLSLINSHQILLTSIEHRGHIDEAFSVLDIDNPYLRQGDFAHRLMPLALSQNLSIVLSDSLYEQNQEFSELIISMVWIACGILLVSLIVSSILSNRITNPLLHLISVTKKIAKGEFQPLDDIKRSSPEIEQLSYAFSSMGQAISSREREILHQAEHDVLTPLINRQTFLKRLDELQQAQVSSFVIAVNVRRFSQINDTMGPQIGDGVLQELAQRLLQYIKSYHHNDQAFAARTNADDFLIRLPARHDKQLKLFMQDLDYCLARSFEIDGLILNLKFRVAALNGIDMKGDASTLLRRVSIAMNAAKSENTPCRYYQDGEDEAYLARLSLVDELKSALEDDDGSLFLCYQPKLNLKTSQANKAEALIRWINKEGKFVNPEMFISIAEQSGLIINLTHWVIAKVIQQLAAWNSLGYHLKVSINMSAQDIQHAQFIDYLLNQIQSHKVSAAQVTIELTERDLVDNERLVVERLSYLKSLGFEVSVDDYGIGQSSLSKLRELPIDELKIDKSFIMTLNESLDNQNIVSSTIDLGHKLGLAIVAEGVENQESLALLKEFGCDLIQGYFLSRPIKAQEFIEWYESYEMLAVSPSE